MTVSGYNILYRGVINMDINLKLKELREKNGYTQQNIADFLNVDQSLISKIEKGERTFTADMLNSLSSLCYNIISITFSLLLSGYIRREQSDCFAFKTYHSEFSIFFLLLILPEMFSEGIN